MDSEFVTLHIVVNGESTRVRVLTTTRLRTVMRRALRQTSNSGQPPDQWELRTTLGSRIDPMERASTFAHAPDAPLFLNLTAGVGASI